MLHSPTLARARLERPPDPARFLLLPLSVLIRWTRSKPRWRHPRPSGRGGISAILRTAGLSFNFFDTRKADRLGAPAAAGGQDPLEPGQIVPMRLICVLRRRTC